MRSVWTKLVYLDWCAGMIEDCEQSGLPYPEAAFEFVREGLPFVVEREHGEASQELRQLEAWMAIQEMDYDDLAELYSRGELPAQIHELIEFLGGPDRVNRHVTGQELCWGLRDYAVKKWGLLAKTVLRQWKVRRTEDFGKIVFALIEEGKLRKQPGDTMEDFKEVYSFDEAFELEDLLNPLDCSE